MGDYSYLYSQLRYWQSEVTRLQNEIKKWKQRKKDVENVQKSLRTVAQNSASDVNSKITKANNKLDHSIDCPTKENLMDSIFRGKNEGNVDSDSNLSSAKGYLQQEIGICESKIATLEGELKNAKNQVSRIQDMIRNLD